MKNNKAFTLVELLAAIMVLGVIALLTTTAITSTVKNSKQDLYDAQLILIKNAAEAWGSENIQYIPYATYDEQLVEKYLLLSDLIEAGNLDEDIENPLTGENFNDNDVVVKITATYSITYQKNLLEYELITGNENIESTKNLFEHVLGGVTSEQ